MSGTPNRQVIRASIRRRLHLRTPVRTSSQRKLKPRARRPLPPSKRWTIKRAGLACSFLCTDGLVTRTFFARAGFVDHDRATVEVFAVQLFDSLLGVFVVGHLD